MIPLFRVEPPEPVPEPVAEAAQCRACHRPLTDEVSLTYRLGPVCRDRRGIALPSRPRFGSCPCGPIPGQLTLFDLLGDMNETDC